MTAQYDVNWSDEDGEWVATSPDFPSISWLAPSQREAIAGLGRIAHGWDDSDGS